MPLRDADKLHLPFKAPHTLKATVSNDVAELPRQPSPESVENFKRIERWAANIRGSLSDVCFSMGGIVYNTRWPSFIPGSELSFTSATIHLGTASSSGSLTILVKLNGATVYTWTVTSGTTSQDEVIALDLAAGDDWYIETTASGTTARFLSVTFHA